MPIPAECQSIQDEIDGVRGERALLQDELQHAGPAEKPGLIQRIKALNVQLADLQKQLEDCIASHPPEPPPLPPIEATFAGHTELKTSFQPAPGPYYADVTLELVISGDRRVITITDFPPIEYPYDTPLGRNTTTITRTGGGTGRYDAGKIVMPITLHFQHSLGDPSDLSLDLSTDPPEGSPVMPEPFGDVTLVGSGRFVGGTLGGSDGHLKVWGPISMRDECARGGPYAATTLGTFKGHSHSEQSVEGDVTLDRVDDGYRLQLTSLHGSITLKQKVDRKSSARLTACGTVTIGEKIDQKSEAIIRANRDVTIKQKVDQESSVDIESHKGSINIGQKIDQKSRATLKAKRDVHIGEKIDQHSSATIVADGDVRIDQGIDQHSTADITSLHGSILIAKAVDGHARAVLRAPNGTIKIGEKVAGGASVQWAAQSFSCPSIGGGTVTEI